MTVQVNAKSLRTIRELHNYISNEGYPINALNFISRLFDFLDSLKTFPEKFPLCRHAIWQKRKYRCGVFENNYVVAYKVFQRHIRVMDIRHAAMLA